MQQAGEEHGVPPLEISFVETMHVIRTRYPTSSVPGPPSGRT